MSDSQIVPGEHADPVRHLIALVRRGVELGIGSKDQASEGQALMAQIRSIGLTASFFGGFDGMKKLHDAAEAATGCTNEIGYVLNLAWDRIGGWDA